tara:strand:+ start:14043 stop:15071 length:1029 start_codon:yes stop_codon:yes gene_type:complete
MNVLVVGGGSIGQRHIANLLKLNNTEQIFVLTKNRNCLNGFDCKNKDRVKLIDSLTNASDDPSALLPPGSSDAKFDFAIIANETHNHIETAINLARQGINLFIEKPLSHNLEKIDELKEIIREKKLKAFVGYNLRFLGALQYIKEQLTKKVIGKLFFSKIEVGHYLPAWKPDEDYRENYRTKKEKGGGVALDLSHEIDYMRFLFGDPAKWKIIKTKTSELEMDTDDLFEGIFEYKEGFICNVHMDFLQQIKKRKIKIIGSNGVINCDFIDECIKIVVIDPATGGKKKEIKTDDKHLFNVPGTYLEEVNHFIKTIDKNVEPDITLNDGVKALMLLEDGFVQGQ